MLVSVEKLDVWNLDELEKEVREEFVRSEMKSGVYKIEIGSRGELEDVNKCDVVDGMIEVMGEKDIISEMDGDDEFVSSYLMEKGIEVDKNMWYEGWCDELYFIYVRVEV